MTYTNEQLSGIYRRTSGYCHICYKKLAFKNYASYGSKGAWEVEHSNPQAKGGTNRLNNLYPACISCNRSKGATSTYSARAVNGKVCAPLTPTKRKEEKVGSAVVGGAAGAVIGIIFGPPGILLGCLLGAHLGYQKNPDI
ncbi:MAG: HNH endonuclease [Gammaproteobacteria bacterium]|nr:HNH endonuclease [Gammaproteobacteria bacterium]